MTAGVCALVGDVPLVGLVLTPLAHLLVDKLCYGTGWLLAGGIASVSRVAALVVV